MLVDRTRLLVVELHLDEISELDLRRIVDDVLVVEQRPVTSGIDRCRVRNLAVWHNNTIVERHPFLLVRHPLAVSESAVVTSW